MTGEARRPDGAVDYRRAVDVAAVERHRLDGVPVDATWDPALRAEMTGADVAIAEEAVADELLEDLAARPPAPRGVDRS